MTIPFSDLLKKNWLRTSLLICIVLRLTTSALMAYLMIFAPISAHPEEVSDPVKIAALESQGEFSRLFLSPWYRWDTFHYLDIVEKGYATPKESVWPPLYPALVKLFSLSGMSDMLAALLVSTFACLAGFILLYKIVSEIWDEGTARQSVFYAAIFPTSFFLMTGYTEALFLALILASFLTARRRKWIAAGILGCLAGLTRNVGILMIFPVLWEGYEAYREKSLKNKKELVNFAVGLALIPAGLAAFFVYVHYGLNFPWPWVSLGHYWDLHWDWPWAGFIGNIRYLAAPEHSVLLNFSLIADLTLAVLTAVMLFWKTEKMPGSFLIFAWALFLLSIVKISSENLLVSVSRYLIPIFPIYISLAQHLKLKSTKLAWAVIFILGQFTLLGCYFTWIWVA